MTAERWGIRGEGWLDVRLLRDRETAYGWAYSIANDRNNAQAIDVYVDHGDGWEHVDSVGIGDKP